MPLPTPGRILRPEDPCHRSVGDRFRRVSFHRSISINFLIRDSSPRSIGPVAPDHPRSDQPGRPGPRRRQSSLPRNYHSSGTHLTGDELLPLHLDVSASRCVGESSSCREPQSSTENNRSGQHDLSGHEHCRFLSDQSVVFAARCDGQTIVTQSPRWSRSSDWSIIPVGRCCKRIGRSNCCEALTTGTNFFDGEFVPSAVCALIETFLKAPALNCRLSSRIISTDRRSPLKI